MIAVVLTLALAAEPCQRVVLLPLEPVATTTERARRVEDQARDVLAKSPNVCVQPRAETVRRLLAQEDRRACRDLACLTAQLTTFDADVIVQGLVLGVGGKDSVDLSITRAQGVARSLGDTSELPALLTLSSPAPLEMKRDGPKWPGFVAAGLSAAALGAGMGLGIAAKERERALTLGTVCSENPGLASCLDGELARGKGEATAANVLFGIGGAFAIGATVLFLVDLP